MKAIKIYEFGGPDVLRYEDIPKPKPGPGEILIRIIVAGVNPIDWKIRSGYIRELPLPTIMGLDVAGIVEAVGQGETSFQPGDEIFAKVSIGQGGYAEYTVTSSTQAAKKPRSIGFVESAAIPTAGLAAWQSLFDIAGLAYRPATVLRVGGEARDGRVMVELALADTSAASLTHGLVAEVIVTVDHRSPLEIAFDAAGGAR